MSSHITRSIKSVLWSGEATLRVAFQNQEQTEMSQMWEKKTENILSFTSVTSAERYLPTALRSSAALSHVRPPHCCVAICALK